jgi:hypothetical protein
MHGVPAIDIPAATPSKATFKLGDLQDSCLRWNDLGDGEGSCKPVLVRIISIYANFAYLAELVLY